MMMGIIYGLIAAGWAAAHGGDTKATLQAMIWPYYMGKQLYIILHDK